MMNSSIVIHKGGKEEKYRLYIEDYVMAFLKEESGTLRLEDFRFYGEKEEEGKYIIYGVSRDGDLSYFDKYSPLEEVGCRLTQAGPVFHVREKEAVYELKGYDIFYQDNREMQNYLINRRKTAGEERGKGDSGHVEPKAEVQKGHVQKMPADKVQHSAISVQLCLVLAVLVAIVINSSNSYDKMNRLNQSATEVLFAIENQDAEKDMPELAASEDERLSYETDDEAAEERGNEVVAETDMDGESQANVPALDETEALKTGAAIGVEVLTQDREETAAILAEESKEEEIREEEPEELQGDAAAAADGQDGVEALSRNVARYYEVEKGDTLYTICRKIYGDIAYVQEICELNEITDPDKIRYGQKIVLP